MALINVSIEINTGPATTAQVVGWASDFRGYQEEIDGAPNPQTRAQFLKAEVAKEVVSWARTQRRYEAQKTAFDAVPDDITGS